MKKNFSLFILLGILSVFVSGAVFAGGFHYTVSTSTRFYVDEAENLAGVRMNWVYDPEVSSIILEGRDVSEAGLKVLAEDMLADLHELGYFAQFAVNGQPVLISKASDYSIKLTDDRRIQLGMQIPLQQSVSLQGKKLSFTLADPDGSGNLLYSGVDRIVLSEELAGKCTKPAMAEKKLNVNDHEITLQTITFSCR